MSEVASTIVAVVLGVFVLFGFLYFTIWVDERRIKRSEMTQISETRPRRVTHHGMQQHVSLKI